MVVLAIGVNALQSMGAILPAFAASSTNAMMQDTHSSLVLQTTGSLRSDSAAAQQPHEASTKLSQYSDNPTIPGDGTPGRTQGSGTR